jgi:hypothetical protein
MFEGVSGCNVGKEETGSHAETLQLRALLDKGVDRDATTSGRDAAELLSRLVGGSFSSFRKPSTIGGGSPILYELVLSTGGC